MAGQAGEYHYAEDRNETDEEKARGIVEKELKRLGWNRDELCKRRKGDREKVKIAKRLRGETTMSLKWVANELEMGAWAYVSGLLSLDRKKKGRS